LNSNIPKEIQRIIPTYFGVEKSSTQTIKSRIAKFQKCRAAVVICNNLKHC
jgi:hypothetical protein